VAALLDVEALVTELLERLCSSPEALHRLREALGELEPPAREDAWMDTKAAAAYLGMKPNALHKLMSARAIPSEQHLPGGKHWFKRSDLDAWRRGAFVSRTFSSGPAEAGGRARAGGNNAAPAGSLEIGAAGFEPATSCSPELATAAAVCCGISWN
jgi:Helix-turn-helix domain